jgi:hypothetical protein
MGGQYWSFCCFHKVIKAEQQKEPGVRNGLINGASAPELEQGNSANAAASATAIAKQMSLFLIISSMPWELTILGCYSMQQYIPQNSSTEHGCSWQCMS